MNTTSKKFQRVFVGPTEISGIAAGLVQGLRELGIKAHLQLSTAHPFEYGDNSSSWLIRIWQKIGNKRIKTPRNHLLRKSLIVTAHNLWGYIILLSAIKNFDAFIFLFGQTITNTQAELWILKHLKKKIIFIYLGSDSRPPYMDGGHFAGAAEYPLPSASALRRVVLRSKRKIRLHEKYADYLINSPATAHFHERKYINWFAMGIPRELKKSQKFSKNTKKNGLIRILHSPSNPLLKGTTEILDTLDRLYKKGYPIEVIKIQNMPNEVVLKELADCDFIVDQLYSDTPLATLATEAAFFGKPAVVGGYLASSENNTLDQKYSPPSLFVAPKDIEYAIERLIVDVKFREELGNKARQFVLSQWSLTRVAARYLQLLNDDVPTQWWCDPSSVDYLRGCGLPEERTKRLISLLTNQFGRSALQVHDKPDLEAALISLVAINEEQRA